MTGRLDATQSESPIDTHVESRKPFYLENSHTFEELGTELSVLNTRQRERYGKIEDIVSDQFVQLYEKFLNPQQILYLAKRQIIYTDHDSAEIFENNWNVNIDSVDPETSAIDGKIYLRYSACRPVDDNSLRTNRGISPHHYWAGRIIIHPLSTEDITDVDEKWLMTDKAYDRLSNGRSKSREEFDERHASILPFINTNFTGSVAVHEKVHGIQDPQLPLPVLEAAAFYYQMQVAEKFDWNSITSDNMPQFALLYEEFVKEVGDDAHLLIFGNIEDQIKKATLIQKLKEKFNTEAIEKASTYHEFEFTEAPWNFIHWKVVPKEEIEQQLKHN